MRVEEVALNWTEKWRVVVVDDHSVTRQGIRVLVDAVSGATVVDDVGSAEEALDVVNRDPSINVVVMDVGLPGMDGIDATRLLRARPKPPAVFVLTMSEAPDCVLHAIDAGAAGFLSKSATLGDFEAMFASLAAREVYIAPVIAGRLVQSLTSDRSRPAWARDSERRNAEDHDIEIDITVPDNGPLSQRERQILAMAGDGLSAGAIAHQLKISIRTVNTHMANVYRKLGVSNRVDAVVEAMRIGVVPAPERHSFLRG